MSKRVSKRGEGCKAMPKGFCLICGEHGTLSKDHVPPKGAITLGKVEQKLMTEVFGAQVDPTVKGIKGNNGSTFRTICNDCNNNHVGGVNDQEVARVYGQINSSLYALASTGMHLTAPLRVNVNAERFLRAMVGHVLSATTNKRCKYPVNTEDKLQPLRSFVLGKNNNIEETHSFYYWFYPFKRHISALGVGVYNEGKYSVVSCLHFSPMAFLIVPKGEGIYPAQAQPISIDTKELILDISDWNLEYATFPFYDLEGNQLIAVDEHSCVTSFPYGQ